MPSRCVGYFHDGVTRFSLGAAVRLEIGFRFVATGIRVEELDDTVGSGLADLQRLADGLYRYLTVLSLSIPVSPARHIVPH